MEHNRNKAEWVAPTPAQVAEVVQALGGRTKVARLLRLSEKAVRAGTTVGFWLTGKSKISPATWAILQAKLKNFYIDDWFNV